MGIRSTLFTQELRSREEAANEARITAKKLHSGKKSSRRGSGSADY